MDITFMNSDNSKTHYRHRPLLKLSDKINLSRNDKYVPLSNLKVCYACRNVKKS